jgi:hypothetical protein
LGPLFGILQTYKQAWLLPTKPYTICSTLQGTENPDTKPP